LDLSFSLVWNFFWSVLLRFCAFFIVGLGPKIQFGLSETQVDFYFSPVCLLRSVWARFLAVPNVPKPTADLASSPVPVRFGLTFVACRFALLQIRSCNFQTGPGGLAACRRTGAQSFCIRRRGCFVVQMAGEDAKVEVCRRQHPRWGMRALARLSCWHLWYSSRGGGLRYSADFLLNVGLGHAVLDTWSFIIAGCILAQLPPEPKRIGDRFEPALNIGLLLIIGLGHPVLATWSFIIAVFCDPAII